MRSQSLRKDLEKFNPFYYLKQEGLFYKNLQDCADEYADLRGRLKRFHRSRYGKDEKYIVEGVVV